MNKFTRTPAMSHSSSSKSTFVRSLYRCTGVSAIRGTEMGSPCNHGSLIIHGQFLPDRQTKWPLDRGTDKRQNIERQHDIRTDKKTDRNTGRQTDKQTEGKYKISSHSPTLIYVFSLSIILKTIFFFAEYLLHPNISWAMVMAPIFKRIVGSNWRDKNKHVCNGV